MVHPDTWGGILSQSHAFETQGVPAELAARPSFAADKIHIKLPIDSLPA